MRETFFTAHHVLILLVGASLTFGAITLAGAQTQEAKPTLPATPVAPSDLAPDENPPSVTGSTWEGTNWGVRITWDPASWTFGDEFITDGYDGVQINSAGSTVYLEAYEGFGGDAEACVDDAESEIRAREGITEVVVLEDRPLPVADDVRGPAHLFGLTAELPDGTAFRGIEYVECRTLVPGEAVLEITWQTAAETFNPEFPLVEDLFATIELPHEEAPAASPVAATPIAGTPGPGLATPVA
jgi:hypothetical protein